MRNQDEHVLIYDYEKKEWVDMCLSFKPGILSIYYPEVSRVLSIDIKKGLFFKNSSIRIVPLKKRCFFKAFRNWLRVSFSMPVLCYEKDVAIYNKENSILLDVGFPFEFPISIKFIQVNEGSIPHIIDTWKMQK